MIAGRDGALYGTTYSAGAFNRGTIFRMTPAGAMTTLYSFTGGAGGEHPTAALLEANDGSFYGMAEAPVAGQEATAVFRMSPAGQFAIVHRFPSFAPVAHFFPPAPVGPLIQAADGNLHLRYFAPPRALFDAGDFSGGQLFSMIRPATSPSSTTSRSVAASGAFPGALIQAATAAFTERRSRAGGNCAHYRGGFGTVFGCRQPGPSPRCTPSPAARTRAVPMPR
jgi:uncharacterized repeat protein (TIGR03803 family)